MPTHNKSLLDAAKHHLLQMLHSNSQGQAASDSVSAGACVTSERDPTAPPKLKRFKFLSQTIDMSPATTSRPSGAEAELDVACLMTLMMLLHGGMDRLPNSITCVRLRLTF